MYIIKTKQLDQGRGSESPKYVAPPCGRPWDYVAIMPSTHKVVHFQIFKLKYCRIVTQTYANQNNNNNNKKNTDKSSDIFLMLSVHLGESLKKRMVENEKILYNSMSYMFLLHKCSFDPTRHGSVSFFQKRTSYSV